MRRMPFWLCLTFRFFKLIAGAAWRRDSSSFTSMPPKRTNANVSRRSGDKGGDEETIIIGEDNDSLASSENGNDHIIVTDSRIVLA